MNITKFFALFLGCISAAYAHEENTIAPPADADKLSVYAGAGLQALSASLPYPAARLPGILEAGSARSNQTGNGLDFAEIGMRANVNDHLKGMVNFARHGGTGGTNDLDQVWLNLRGNISESEANSRVGRQYISAGFLNLQDPHTRQFGIAPLTMRAMVNDSLRADGVRADVQLNHGIELGAGAWMNQGFPGTSDNHPDMNSARLAWTGETFKLEADYVHTAVSKRALSTLGQVGHTHTVPTCTVASASLVCLQGAANLWTLAGRWQPSPNSLWIDAEYWQKSERGILSSNFGSPNYQGNTYGGWLEIGYPISPEMQVLARSEQLIASHQLIGANAALVAAQAGIVSSNNLLTSQAVALLWQPYPEHKLSAEWHQENLGATNNNILLLRYQMQFKASLL